MLRQQNGHAVKKRHISNVKVINIEKRKDTKNLEFLLNVLWTNGECSTISRQYSMFFDLLGGIKLIFQDIHDVSIPDLPVPKFQVTMLFSSLAKKESRVIEEFCQKLIKLPAVISQSDIVEKFFSEWGTDIVYKESKPKSPVPSRSPPTDRRDGPLVSRYRALASYQASTSGEMSMEENEILMVIEKNQTGWWLVTNEEGQHGFAPATFLEPVDNETHMEAEEWIKYDGQTRVWIAIQPYTAQSDDEVSYNKGDEMEVIATSSYGWWKVRFKGKVGVTPASNLVAKPSRNNDAVFDNPLYDETPMTRRSSFTSVGTIYASIRKPPPRRESSKKHWKKSNEPVKDATLAYATVYVSNDEFIAAQQAAADQDLSSNKENELYSTVLPKYLRQPQSPKKETNKIEDVYEEILNEGPPPVPLCFVDETATLARRKDEEAERESPVPQRRKSAEHPSSTDTKTHGYLNVPQGDVLNNRTNLYRAITEYQVPIDRHDDLPLSAGCIVRALTKDETFFFVSTLDEPPQQGWVPEHVLENLHARGANRRSRSLGDLLSESLQGEPIAIKIKNLHDRTPVAAPRTDKTKRYFSFDATNTNDDHLDDTNNTSDRRGSHDNTSDRRGSHDNMASEIQSLNFSSLSETEPWFHGKMNRNSCEERMLKSARELDFMIRESTQRFASYVLSVMFSKKVRHFPIETTPSKKFVIGRHAFDSLPAIVDFFSKNPLFYTQNKEPISLGQPFVLHRY